MTRTVRTAAALLVLLFALPATAQVARPPRPEKVHVELRYRIRADREERVRQYRLLNEHLKELGFERTRKPDDELDEIDPTAERMEGVIPSKSVLKLLDEPRVQTILFRPTDYQYPADANAPVPIRIKIASGFLLPEQHRFHRQVVEQLAKMGFREFVAYDHENYSNIRGDFPAGQLPRLLKDLRREPSGWLLPDTMPDQLPAPLREVLPIRWVEVLPGADLTLFTPAAVPPQRLRFTPDLRAVFDDAMAVTKPLRVEVVMDRRITETDQEMLRTRLRGFYGREAPNPITGKPEQVPAVLDGVVGNVATIRFVQAVDAERFLQEPGVASIRLPRAAVETAGAAAGKLTTTAEALSTTRVLDLQKLGYRGQGTRIVVIATEFPELGSAFGVRFLEKSLRTPVHFIDLTAELNTDLRPAPERPAITAGTTAARAAHLAASGATLVLVRIDPAAFFQVDSIARHVRGSEDFTVAMTSRIIELSLRTEELRLRNDAAVKEYRRAFSDFSDEEAPRQRREQARQALNQLIIEETEHAATIARATRLQRAMRDLVAAEVVVNTVEWETGFQLDGLSAVSQRIDTTFASEALGGPRSRSATRPRPAPRPIWVQAASPSIDSVWTGPFVDREGNQAMEFAPANAKLPAGLWTDELNFLATRSTDGMTTTGLPAGTKVRLTMQWRETHDPSGYGGHDSIFPITLRVLQQLDPEGKTRSSDELKEIARSVGGPYRVYAEPTYGVYEQIVEFTVPPEGRIALRVEGGTIYDSRLPALERHIEVQPRLYAEFVGVTDKGRPVFTPYAPVNAGVGIPGDAKAAITVGTLTGGLTGGGPGLELLIKPDVFADGSIDVGAKVAGPGVSAGFAAGIIADLLGSGAPASDVLGATGLRRGSPITVPEGWLKVVPPRR
jgi:hypothetical protein